jgi:hypothetical protein
VRNEKSEESDDEEDTAEYIVPIQLSSHYIHKGGVRNVLGF